MGAMAEIVFWEKPGCAGNARQVALLRASGHSVTRRDLSAEGWTARTLHPFFGDAPVADWFNRGAPKVKSGEIVPESHTAETALALFMQFPLLIRRPLIESDGVRSFGFDQAKIAAWLGLTPVEASVGEGCPRPDMPPCPPPVGVSHD
jgi:nitrogenase-associated protein